MPFVFAETPIEGVFIITAGAFEDKRGYFMETYSKLAFEKAGIKGKMVQQNHSRSVQGVLRGLHFQRYPHAQAKLVRCTRGEVFDVAVDVRSTSPTFGKWVSLTLTESHKQMLYLPRGLAHGFQVTSELADVQYIVDNPYSPESERGVIWSDPDLNIPWPIASPILSDRDTSWPKLNQLKRGRR